MEAEPRNTSVFECRLITLPKINNLAGNITPLHSLVELPFELNRVFYLYDIPGGESRGAHAHKECHQFIVAACGSFEVHVDDGKFKQTFYLNRPYLGLHIPSGIWAAEQNFSSGSICLVFASHFYDEGDYIRDYNQYNLWKSSK